MNKFKTLVIVALLMIGFTGAVLVLSHSAAPRISPEMVKNTQTAISETLNEKVLNAEAGLKAMGDILATDEKLVSELAEVREKLKTTSAADLKKQSTNKWNEAVFNRLIAWRDQQAANLNKGFRAGSDDNARSTATDRNPLASWWNRKPDLLLAFANVPTTDGTVSTLVAFGDNGKQLRAGGSYEHEIAVLREVQESNKSAVSLFLWDNKMYLAVTSPIQKDGEQIGQSVLGMELTRGMADNFIKSMPPHMNLVLYHMARGESKNDFHYFSSMADDSIRTLRDTPVVRYSDVNNPAAAKTKLEEVNNNDTYLGDVNNHMMSFARMRWIWDEKQEAGFYIVSDQDMAGSAWSNFRQQVIISGAIFLILGLLAAFLLLRRQNRRLEELKVAILEGLNSGNPVDTKPFSCLPGIEHAELGNFIIKSIDEDEGADANIDLSNLLMDIDEEDDAPAETSKSADDAQKPEAEKSAEPEKIDPAMKALYDDYMAKRKQTGNNAEMPYDQFLRRINRNIEKIHETHPNAEIVFNATIQNGKAVLSPSLKNNKK